VAPDEQKPPGSPDASPPAPAGAPPPPKPSVFQLVRRAPVASLIIAINVIVFGLASRTGSTTQNDTLLRFGALWRPLVWQGEYWRLATAMFLHIGVVHLLANSYFGFGMSAQVERAMGWWRFLALYLLSGIAGSAVSVIGHNAISAGASGALFGLIGWQIMVARVQTGSFRAMWNDRGIRRGLVWIGGWFIIGVYAHFDNYAHAGGLGFGLLFTWALISPPPRRRRRVVVTLVSLAALVALSLRPLPVIHATDRALQQAFRSQNDPAAVLALTEPLLTSKRRFDAQLLRGRALLNLGRFQEAIDVSSEAIAEIPSDATSYVTRGGARLMLGDTAGAEADFQHALALDSGPQVRETIAAYRNARPR
jgi:membrane associated rhomboid family serine protease